MRSREGRGRVALRLLAVVCVTGCFVRTDLVGQAFNTGALDSNGDPFRVQSALAASRVERIVEQEVADGYFNQGHDALVATWLDAQANDVTRFVRSVRELNRQDHTEAGTPGDHTAFAKKRHLHDVSTYTNVREPLCKKVGSPDTHALETFLDDVRFKEATWRAKRRIAALELEGLVDDTAVHDGALEAFQRLSRYVRNRKWVRRETQKTTALAIEGGAASGIFSAGAVWVALNLMNRWMSQCDPNDAPCVASKDVRFRLISGTSTGAMVAVAVDRFNAMITSAGRKKEIDNIARWFTCFSFKDLMCVQSKGVDQLFSGSTPLHGVLQFDGIQKVLTSCVKQYMFDDVSELILNTTEFRTGRIYALSDQNEMTKPFDVVHAALASALLPIIGEPDTDVWDGVKFDPQYDPDASARTRPAYLDGGIRSELPILPLVRRGAERVLAVASGASMITEVARLENALGVAPRYININTGAAVENEVEYAQRVVEDARQNEIASCTGALADAPQLCDSSVCSKWNVCHDELARACEPEAKDAHKTEADETLAQRCDPFWRMVSIFVDNSNVDSLSGYNFQPSELRRLFRAGAEAARVRCLDLSRLLGILPDGAATSAQIANVNEWCAATMLPASSLCAPDTPKPATTFVARPCLDPLDLDKLPERLADCPSDGTDKPQ